jgi:hypothetical protein
MAPDVLICRNGAPGGSSHITMSARSQISGRTVLYPMTPGIADITTTSVTQTLLLHLPSHPRRLDTLVVVREDAHVGGVPNPREIAGVTLPQ